MQLGHRCFQYPGCFEGQGARRTKQKTYQALAGRALQLRGWFAEPALCELLLTAAGCDDPFVGLVKALCGLAQIDGYRFDVYRWQFGFARCCDALEPTLPSRSRT
jgi:hypothetical protein